MSLASEFKAFAMRGNVIDLAVGVVIGGAFGRIISSLVDAIIMPVIGILTAGADVSTLAVTIGHNAKGDPVLLRYGVFCQNVLDFLIVAFVIFLAVKAINKLQAPPPAPVAAPEPAPSVDTQLLAEIRDLLAKR
jgi:large conductance mechanosensitive channel